MVIDMAREATHSTADGTTAHTKGNTSTSFRTDSAVYICREMYISDAALEQYVSIKFIT